MPDLSDLIQRYSYDPATGRDLVAIVETKNLWHEVGADDPDPNNYRCQQMKIESREELKEFESYFFDLFKDVLIRYSSAVATPANADTGYTLIKYREGDFCSLHCDVVPHEIRVFTAIFYVNDDYEGGELVFPNQDLVLKPKAGEVVVTPAMDQFPHEVRPVTRGDRYVVRCFYICQLPESLSA